MQSPGTIGLWVVLVLVLALAGAVVGAISGAFALAVRHAVGHSATGSLARYVQQRYLPSSSDWVSNGVRLLIGSSGYALLGSAILLGYVAPDAVGGAPTFYGALSYSGQALAHGTRYLAGAAFLGWAVGIGAVWLLNERGLVSITSDRFTAGAVASVAAHAFFLAAFRAIVLAVAYPRHHTEIPSRAATGGPLSLVLNFMPITVLATVVGVLVVLAAVLRAIPSRRHLVSGAFVVGGTTLIVFPGLLGRVLYPFLIAPRGGPAYDPVYATVFTLLERIRIGGIFAVCLGIASYVIASLVEPT